MPGPEDVGDEAPCDGGTCPNMGDCEGEVYGGGPCNVCDGAVDWNDAVAEGGDA